MVAPSSATTRAVKPS